MRYKLEGIPAGVSIEKFCMSNQVPYNLFAKWYKDTHKKIVPVQVLGAPSPESEMKEILSPIRDGKPEVDTRLSSGSELRILVDIRMSNGVHISQKNLSYAGLKSLVEKLEGIPESLKTHIQIWHPDEKSKMTMELMAACEWDAELIRRDETQIDELFK